ncbi:uncharacterized protein SEPMUDRAFT_151386 [Sphaerulina musiva SO2202]|uniref:UBL3-like ubiquitin domain-containing protein n=1 Tax=Sphaerulina musiva (strain SO2202) TaxID=692275 RepID=N1QED3_SPHMS|nr:uncharacterized protein SEPMUDRAFT_151386 [Sphaerulina musiva SO2202]EMF09312.1 hypothetical protein SEPMUDRAFT_151386 [Sphaerulina musiva SO2202]
MGSLPDAVAGASLPTTSTARALSEEENTPVEMSTLNAASRNDVAVGTPGSLGGLEDAVQTQPAVAASMATEPAPAIAGSSQPVSTTSASAPPPQDNLRRTETEHLGPAIEGDAPLVPSSTVSAGPVLMISLMLITGARHPYKIDEKYLRNRKVIAQDSSGAFNPRELSGYQLKELIWTDWRQEWEPRPSSPGRIRLIVMGRMIEDKGLLKDLPFNMTATNVVHMTVKPADIIDDDEAANAKSTGKVARQRESEEQGAGCRCVIL